MNKKTKSIYTGKVVSSPKNKRSELFRELEQVSVNEYRLQIKGNIQSVEIFRTTRESTLRVKLSRAGSIDEVCILMSQLKRLLPGLSQIKLRKEALFFGQIHFTERCA